MRLRRQTGGRTLTCLTYTPVLDPERKVRGNEIDAYTFAYMHIYVLLQ